MRTAPGPVCQQVGGEPRSVGIGCIGYFGFEQPDGFGEAALHGHDLRPLDACRRMQVDRSDQAVEVDGRFGTEHRVGGVFGRRAGQPAIGGADGLRPQPGHVVHLGAQDRIVAVVDRMLPAAFVPGQRQFGPAGKVMGLGQHQTHPRVNRMVVGGRDSKGLGRMAHHGFEIGPHEGDVRQPAGRECLQRFQADRGTERMGPQKFVAYSGIGLAGMVEPELTEQALGQIQPGDDRRLRPDRLARTDCVDVCLRLGAPPQPRKVGGPLRTFAIGLNRVGCRSNLRIEPNQYPRWLYSRRHCSACS